MNIKNITVKLGRNDFKDHEYKTTKSDLEFLVKREFPQISLTVVHDSVSRIHTAGLSDNLDKKVKGFIHDFLFNCFEEDDEILANDSAEWGG